MEKQAKNKEVVISVRDLKLSFYTDKGRVKALRGVSFDVYKGEVLCIVGESGSGKSVTAKTIMGILPGNGRVDGGSIIYQGEDLTKVSEEDFHQIRGKKIGMIFQDPLSSLNPIMRIGRQITEAMIINGDKIKRRYEALILEDLIAYKNAVSRKKAIIEQMKSNRDLLIDEFKDEIKAVKQDTALSDDVKKERIAAIHQKISKAKSDTKAQIDATKVEYAPKIAATKATLKDKSKQAKVEVKAYKAGLVAERNKKLKDLNAQLKMAVGDAKQPIKDEIEKVKLDFINSVKLTHAEAKKQAIKVMEEVGIPQAARRFRQYPFEFSGGMRQRIVIAIALTQNPDILILDEPTTALDVTIQAQILDLVNKLKRERQLSCIFITHDLGVVANMADRIAVMYAGKIVEYGLSEEVFYDPRHPYTWALLSSIPDVDTKEKLESIPGTPPNMIYPPKGDAFALRSKYAMAIDFKEEPPFFKLSDTHYAATWLLDPRAPQAQMPKIVSERIRISLEKAGIKHGA